MKLTVKQARIGVGYSQKTMANLLHVNYQTYRRWEEKPALINVENALKIANITKVDFRDIIFF